MASTANPAIERVVEAYNAVHAAAASTVDPLQLMSAVSGASVALDGLRDLLPSAAYNPLCERNLELVERAESAVVALLAGPEQDASSDSSASDSPLHQVQNTATAMTTSLEKLLIPKLIVTRKED
ncbi:hypothetical protein BD626DRAFT_631525 [Schizophyllum amplum]|uniref:Uncharacterized protein n=1 Tax=Schizophyllum amplum TaxID=97359 RepID=A0A550CAS9_9AGAR|nr:hypothetical protein BD626DRAFT_631525 [Auriculariopsis ampla]